MIIPELRTERLLMRGWRESDLDAWAAIAADAETMRWVGEEEPLDREEAWRQIAYLIGHWELRGFGQWALEELDGGALVGRVGLNQPEGWPGLELGWLVARPCWGRGYATEAARASLRWARGARRPAPDQPDRGRQPALGAGGEEDRHGGRGPHVAARKARRADLRPRSVVMPR